MPQIIQVRFQFHPIPDQDFPDFIEKYNSLMRPWEQFKYVMTDCSRGEIIIHLVKGFHMPLPIQPLKNRLPNCVVYERVCDFGSNPHNKNSYQNHSMIS